MHLIEKRYGGDKLQGMKILVAYATRAGSAAEIADALGKKLAEGGATVDVMPAKKVSDLNAYNAVVLGSAIRAGRIMPEIMKLIKDHKDDLQKIPVAYFIVCLVVREKTEENFKTADKYLEPFRRELKAVDSAVFAGKMDYSQLGFWEKFIIKYVIDASEGDWRDWPAINKWAENLLPKLTGGN